MLQITRRVDYALLALTHLALELGERRSARELAEAYGLSRPLMANVLKALVRGELVRSVRGTKGGYELALEPAAVPVGRVVELLEGPLQLADCVGSRKDKEGGCGVARVCPVKRSVLKIHVELRDVLYGHTLAELAARAGLPGEALPVARSSAAPAAAPARSSAAPAAVPARPGAEPCGSAS